MEDNTDSLVSSPLSYTPTSVPSSAPSSPLSQLSRSPSPPRNSPSLSTSHEPLGLARTFSTVSSIVACDHEGAPPAKRRRVMKAKEPKKTEYLDLGALNNSDNGLIHEKEDPKLKKLVDALRNKSKIVVIAGAGISTTAGIPDFRSNTGLFKTLRGQHNLKSSGKHLFDASVYKDDSSTSSFHTMVRELSHLTKNAQPTPFHHMLATIAEQGRLMRLYTQNVDGIDVALEPLKTTVPLDPKGPWPRTIQLHGGLGKMVCSSCAKLFDFDGTLFEGPEAPPCPECEEAETVRAVAGHRSRGVGRLRPRMVLYNEHNPDEDAIGAASCADLKSRPDAVIVVGTSLKVPGIRRLAKELCGVARDKRGGFTAWINHDPEPTSPDVKDCWDLVVTGDCDDVAHHVNLPKWDEKDCGEYKKLAEDERVASSQVSVIIKTINNGLPTPAESPRLQSPSLATEGTVLVETQHPKVLKQSALPFAGPPTEKAKPKPRKKPQKPQQPKNPKPSVLVTSFAATKTTAQPSKSMKKEKSKLSAGNIKSEPKLATINKGIGYDIMPNRYFMSSTRSREIPQTPSPPHSSITVEVPVKTDWNEIISPKTSPKGMQNLLC